MSFVHEMYENTQLNYTKCSWQTCTSLHIKLISGDVSIFSSSHTRTHKPISLHTTLISLHTTPLSGGYVYFLVATLPTNLYHYVQHFYHYIKHLYQGGLYIFRWPHCPQTYITPYNTYINTYNTSIRGVFVFPGGHTAHKLISPHTTLLSLHQTPLSRGGLYIFWWPHCPQTYITTYNTYITT